MSRAASVRPAPWGSVLDVAQPAPGWTTRTGGSGTTVRPSPISGAHPVANDVTREDANVVSLPPPSRRADLRAAKELEALPPSSRRPPPSRVAIEARVQTLGEALSESRSEAAHLRAELEAARRASATQAEAFAAEKAALAASAERELVRLAMAVARRVVLREVATDPGLVVAWAREVMEGAGLAGASVAVAPDIEASVPSEAWGALAADVTTDPHLAPGAIELREGARTAQAGAAARLGALAEALGLTEGDAPPNEVAT